VAVSDQADGESEECFVDVIASFPADAKASEAVKPGDCALDDVAEDAQAEEGNAIGEGEQRADPWIVLEPVARAIAVVEELEDGEQLFTRTLYRYAKGTCMPRTGLSSDTAVEPRLHRLGE
jgi:hypothetical protein